MRAVVNFVVAVVKLAVYVVIFAGIAYAAILWRAELVTEANRLGVPASIVEMARAKLDQGAIVVVQLAKKAPFTLPIALPSTAPTTAEKLPAPGGQQQAAAAPATAAAPAPVVKPAVPAGPAIAVLAAEVRTESVPVVLDLLGTVQPVASIPVKVRLDSQMAEVAVKEGDKVKAGQLIFKLDSRAVEAQIRQAEAVVVKDQALVAQTAAELARVAPLSNSSFLSKKDLDTAKAAADTAVATVGADKAALDNLKVQLSYYDIHSPIDGRVGSLPYKPGASIRAADATLLATINQITPVYVAFAVPQSNVAALREALADHPLDVSIHIPGSSGGPLPGKIAFTENQIDSGSGTLMVKALVDNAAERLIPGQFVDVRVILRVDDKAVTVPEAAVLVGQNGTYSFIIKPDDTVDLRPVVRDRTVDGRTVISHGLTPGEKVVVDGQARLVQNSRVEVRPPAAPSQPGAASSPKQQTGS
ncbi:MAG: efflux RND transporter periplasmic adaptor subunit [Ancalomicrobiaceae bacterium]|nr:efflux RND transporter periplasmic adaptor subunit [Ancalomicrobiaceae bacterium]